ncbi:MAG TPA: hypothetical protein PLV83_04710 [Bacilli bacterium]|nr:hypothetical protein [Bacilli bacterium]
MEKIEFIDNYLNVFLRETLKIKKGDVIFLSASLEDEIYIERLKELVHAAKANICVNYYEKECSKEVYYNIIKSNAKLVFVLNDHIHNTIAEFLCECNINNEGDINSYMLAPLNHVLNRNNLEYLDSRKYNNNQHAFKEKQRDIAERIKILKSARLYIRNLNDIELSCDFNNYINSNFNIKKYPNYVLELVPLQESVNGYVNASSNAYYKGLVLEDLKLYIENSVVRDFDCKDKETSELFKNEGFVLDKIGLTSKNNPSINFSSSRINLDNDPYLLLKSSDDSDLYVPINSKSLVVAGDLYTQKENIYENNDFTDKVYKK